MSEHASHLPAHYSDEPELPAETQGNGFMRNPPSWLQLLNVIFALAAVYGIYIQNANSLVALEHRLTASEVKQELMTQQMGRLEAQLNRMEDLHRQEQDRKATR